MEGGKRGFIAILLVIRLVLLQCYFLFGSLARTCAIMSLL